MQSPPQPLPGPESYDGALGRKIIELHIWAVQQGLQGAAVDVLFDGLCRRLVAAGVPLWRTFAGMRTLHPQWGGYAYTWWRDSGIERPAQFARGNQYEQNLQASVFGHLRRQADEQGNESRPLLHLRRRLVGRWQIGAGRLRQARKRQQCDGPQTRDRFHDQSRPFSWRCALEACKGT